MLNADDPTLRLLGTADCSPNACFAIEGTVRARLENIEATNCL